MAGEYPIVIMYRAEPLYCRGGRKMKEIAARTGVIFAAIRVRFRCDLADIGLLPVYSGLLPVYLGFNKSIHGPRLNRPRAYI